MRKKILRQRDQTPAAQREAWSVAIQERLLALPVIQKSGCIFVYVHFRSEVQTDRLINNCLAAGKIVAVPLTQVASGKLAVIRITDPVTQLVPGYAGIPEPRADLVRTNQIDPHAIEVALVPGSVFDNRGGRLGYGGGYYDRFLANKAPEAYRIGLAFALQIQDRVPQEPHDQRMDMVMTETDCLTCRRPLS